MSAPADSGHPDAVAAEDPRGRAEQHRYAEVERRREELVAAAAAPLLAAVGVADPQRWATEVDRHLVALGYVLGFAEDTAAEVDAHAVEHWLAMAIDLTVYAATHTGRDWGACVAAGRALLAALAPDGITLTALPRSTMRKTSPGRWGR